MRTMQIIMTCLLAACTTCIVGCNGPTKAGLEARENAYNRIDRVNTQISFGQAKQAFEVGKLREALKTIDEAVARYPEASEYHLLRGRILMEMHRLDEAHESLHAAIEQDDELSEPYYFLGILHQRWSEDKEAHVNYMRAADLDSTKAQYLLAATEMLVSLKRYNEAEGLLKSRARKFEHHPSMRHLLGQLSMLQGKSEQAASYYKEASLLQPDDMELMAEVAYVQFMAGLISECLTTISTIVYRGCELDQQLMLIKARCLVQAQRYVEARPLYKQMLVQSEHDINLWEEAGYLAWTIEDWRGLRECGKRITSLSPESSIGWTLLAVSERADNRYVEAEKHLQTAVECTDASALSWVLLSQLHERSGDQHEAAKAWKSAVDLDESLSTHTRLVDGTNTDG